MYAFADFDLKRFSSLGVDSSKMNKNHPVRYRIPYNVPYTFNVRFILYANPFD